MVWFVPPRLLIEFKLAVSPLIIAVDDVCKLLCLAEWFYGPLSVDIDEHILLGKLRACPAANWLIFWLIWVSVMDWLACRACWTEFGNWLRSGNVGEAIETVDFID